MPAQAAKYRTAGTMGLCSVAFLAFTFIVRVVQGLQAGLTWWVVEQFCLNGCSRRDIWNCETFGPKLKMHKRVVIPANGV